MRLYKQLIKHLTVAILMCSVFIAFNDVYAGTGDLTGHWAEKQVKDWLNQGLIKGYGNGSFQPDKVISRAEFVTIVNRSTNLPGGKRAQFADVTQKDWFAPEIDKAVEAGLIKGYGDNKVKPYSTVSRQEAALILANLLKLNMDLPSMKTEEKIPEWSQKAVSAVVAKGYMRGYPDGTFRPTKLLTRAETVAILNNALGQIINKTGESRAKSIDGNVTINVAESNLTDVTINGNLYLTPGIGDGTIKLTNVKVTGTTLVSGGGIHSIILKDSTLGVMQVNKKDGQVRVLTTGTSSVKEALVESGATLEEEDVKGAGFERVNLSDKIPLKAEVRLDGNFQEVKVAADKINVKVDNGLIEKLEVTKNANETKVVLDGTVTVNKLEVSGRAEIAGQAKLKEANIYIDGIKLEAKPEVTNFGQGVASANIAGQNVNNPQQSTPSYSGGGGSGGGGSDPPTTKAVTSLALNSNTLELQLGEKKTLEYTITPADANNREVSWSSTDPSVVNVVYGSVYIEVTGVSVGTTNISVTSKDGNKQATCAVTVVSTRRDAIAAAISAIQNLPDQITYDDKTTVTRARQLVDAAIVLGASQSDISNYDRLTASESQLQAVLAGVGTVQGFVYTPNGTVFIPTVTSKAEIHILSSRTGDMIDTMVGKINNDGSFEVGNLEPGEYGFYVGAEGDDNPYFASNRTLINIVAGTVYNQNLALTVPQVTGYVYEPDGSLVDEHGIWMLFLFDGYGEHWAPVNSRGFYKIGVLQNGQYETYARVINLAVPYTDSNTQTVDISEDTPIRLDFTLSVPQLTGQVFGPNGEVLTLDENNIVNLRIGGREFWADNDGTFKIGGLAPGSYECLVVPSGTENPFNLEQILNITIPTEGSVVQNVYLTSAQIIGSVLTPDGVQYRPTVGEQSQVDLIREDGAWLACGRVGSDGNFNFGEQIPAGNYFLQVRVDSAKSRYTDSFKVPITLEAGKSNRTKLQLTNPQLSGRVFTPDGGIITLGNGIEVDLHLSGPTSYSLRVQEDGYFKVGALLPGEYDMAIVPNGPNNPYTQDNLHITIPSSEMVTENVYLVDLSSSGVKVIVRNLIFFEDPVANEFVKYLMVTKLDGTHVSYRVENDDYVVSGNQSNATMSIGGADNLEAGDFVYLRQDSNSNVTNIYLVTNNGDEAIDLTVGDKVYSVDEGQDILTIDGKPYSITEDTTVFTVDERGTGTALNKLNKTTWALVERNDALFAKAQVWVDGSEIIAIFFNEVNIFANSNLRWGVPFNSIYFNGDGDYSVNLWENGAIKSYVIDDAQVSGFSSNKVVAYTVSADNEIDNSYVYSGSCEFTVADVENVNDRLLVSHSGGQYIAIDGEVKVFDYSSGSMVTAGSISTGDVVVAYDVLDQDSYFVAEGSGDGVIDVFIIIR